MEAASARRHLSPFHICGLWLAVRTIPATSVEGSWARVESVMTAVVGVIATPRSTTRTPGASDSGDGGGTNHVAPRAPVTSENDGDGSTGGALDEPRRVAPAKRAMTSGVSDWPTIPRQPETLSMSGADWDITRSEQYMKRNEIAEQTGT